MLYRLNRALSRIDLDFKEILHHSFYAFLMLFLAGIAQIGFDLILARRFGASDYGIFYLAFYTLVMLSLFGRFGLNKAVIKFIPKFKATKNWGEIIGLKKTADRLALSFTVVIAIITFNLAPIIANSFFHKPEVSLYLRYFSIALPALSFLYIQTGVLSGLKLVGQAVFIERTGMNLVAIIIMLSLGAVFGIKSAVIGTMAGIFLFAYLGSLMIKRSIPGASKPVLFNKKVLLSLAAPLFLVDFSNQMIGQINALVLGGHVQASEVGVFNAALRLSGVISVVLTGINAIATTKIAEVYHSGSRKKLALLSSKTAALAIFCGLPLISMFTIWPQFFLGLFGSEFVTGSFALRVLVIGQAANLLSGSVVQILSMTEYHKEVGYITFVTAVILNLILTALLVPSYGINGAALAVGISLTLQNVILLLMVKRYLNIWSLPGRAMSHWLRPSKT